MTPIVLHGVQDYSCTTPNLYTKLTGSDPRKTQMGEWYFGIEKKRSWAGDLAQWGHHLPCKCKVPVRSLVPKKKKAWPEIRDMSMCTYTYVYVYIYMYMVLCVHLETVSFYIY